MRILLISFLFLLTACGGKSPAKTHAQESPIPSSVGVKEAETGRYHISIQSRQQGQRAVLILYDKTTHGIDSLDLGDVSADAEYTHITNMTKTLGFDKLALIIDWRGDSDHMYSKLLGYWGDTLKIIYEDPNPGGIKELSRKDQWTLTGFSYGQDELTGDYNILCPLTIDLRTAEGTILQPDTAAVLFETEAKEPIFAYRVSRSGKEMDYMIPAGTAFRIDTIFNGSKNVVLSIGDSILLHTKIEQLQSKIRLSDAG